MTKQGKNFKIWGIRHSCAGDLLFAAPILNYLELKYPDSYKYFAIAKKCAGFAPLFFNYKYIDCIHILQNKESLGPKDLEVANSCDLIINTEPQCKEMPGTTFSSCWWNWFNCYEMAFTMAGFDISEYRGMPKEMQIPVLNQWFDVEKQKNVIALWPFTREGIKSGRSPSKEWWEKFVYLILRNTDYKIYQLGGLDDPDIFNFGGRYNTLTRIKKVNSLPVLDQYKLALGCDININTNSGSGIILGAYGKEQITLLTDDAPNHFQNPLAFAPLNYKNNNTNIFVSGGFDNLSQETVIEKIKERLINADDNKN